jgi:predicted CopG family antitoxin
MTSKSISITTDTYELLDKFRLKNESFSQAIMRLLKNQADILELAGAWAKITDVGPAIEIIEKTVKKVHDAAGTIILL